MTSHTMPVVLGFINNIGLTEWVIILIIMLLLFGRRLPEVGKSLGKGIVEFKKGLSGIEDDINQAGRAPNQGAGQSAWMQQNQQLPPNQPMGGMPQQQTPMGAPPQAVPREGGH